MFGLRSAYLNFGQIGEGYSSSDERYGALYFNCGRFPGTRSLGLLTPLDPAGPGHTADGPDAQWWLPMVGGP